MFSDLGPVHHREVVQMILNSKKFDLLQSQHKQDTAENKNQITRDVKNMSKLKCSKYILMIVFYVEDKSHFSHHQYQNQHGKNQTIF